MHYKLKKQTTYLAKKGHVDDSGLSWTTLKSCDNFTSMDLWTINTKNL